MWMVVDSDPEHWKKLQGECNSMAIVHGCHPIRFVSKILQELLVTILALQTVCYLTCFMRAFMSGNDVRHLFLNRHFRLPVLRLTERLRRYSLYKLQ
jgi:hypothetical protein